MRGYFILAAAMTCGIFACCSGPAAPTKTEKEGQPLKQALAERSYRLVWECYVNNNWEIFTSRADGSRIHNLTNSPGVHEHDPHPSPDGKFIAYTVDAGEGRKAIRSLWVMNSDGSDRKQIADYAREPFWSPDSKRIGYLPQLYPKFSVAEAYNKGMLFYDVTTGKTEPHPNSDGIRRIYNPSYSRNDKWIAVVKDGEPDGLMLIEAHGSRFVDLHCIGCRPNLAPDCKHIAWGATDHELCIAPIDLSADNPVVGKPQLLIRDSENKIYHIHWSPDSSFVAFSRGPNGEGDISKPGTFQSPNEIIGVYGAGWNICVVNALKTGVLDLHKVSPCDFLKITSNGASNKQPEWVK